MTTIREGGAEKPISNYNSLALDGKYRVHMHLKLPYTYVLTVRLTFFVHGRIEEALCGGTA